MLLALILVAALTLSLCWLLFQLASLALPLFVAALAAHAAWSGGSGFVGTIAVGLGAGAATLFGSQFLLATLRDAGSRTAVILVFVSPAAIAGFSAAHGGAVLGGASPAWAVLLGLAGSICVALAAMARLRAGVPVDRPRQATDRAQTIRHSSAL